MSDLINALDALKIANKRIDQLEKYNLDLANESHRKSARIAAQKEQNNALREALEVLREATEHLVDDSLVLFMRDGRKLNLDMVYDLVDTALEAEM